MSVAAITAKVNPAEDVKLWPWARVEPNVRHGGTPAGSPIATATADGNGVVTFNQESRIEYAIQRADGRFLKVMDSHTVGWPSPPVGPT